MATLLELSAAETLTARHWTAALDKAREAQQYVADQTYITRKKDFDNPFRQMTFDTPEEMTAVLGSAEKNSFVKQVRQETDQFAKLIEDAKNRA